VGGDLEPSGSFKPCDEWGGCAGRAGPARPQACPDGHRRAIPLRQSGRPATPRAASAPSPCGAAMFRVSRRGEAIDHADTLEGARGIVRPGPALGAVRYRYDEIRAELFLFGHTSRARGI